MTRAHWATAALLVVVASVASCAHRTDDKVRKAFEKSDKKAARDGGGTDKGGDGGDRPTVIESSEQGWDRVHSVIRQSARILALSGDDKALAQLAQRWCEVEPTPQNTPHGPVRVCFPEPPVAAGGHAFSLELGAVGVIGLVAGDLTRNESRELVQEALRLGSRVCAEPWQTPERDSNVSEEFHTCPVGGGPMFTVGRFPLDLSGNVWQVSLAVLAAS